MVLFVWAAALIAAAISAALLAAFALFVGALGRFQGSARWFAMFGFGFGATAGLGNVAEAAYTAGPAAWENGARLWLLVAFEVGQMVFACLWIYGGWKLLRGYGVGRFRAAWAWWLMLALGVVDMALLIPVYLATEWGIWSVGIDVAYLATQAFRVVAVSMMAAGSIMLAFAYRRDQRRDQLVLASALCLYPIAWPVWVGVVSLLGGMGRPGALILGAGSMLLVLIVWLRTVEVTRRPSGLFVVAAAGVAGLAGLLMGVYIPAFSPSSIARTAEVLLVAYAIMRHQYLGLDVKIRWTLSKSTLAAIFVAVFFVVSEGAAAIFTNLGGSEYLGIAGAGLLLFAIAPLNRFADRFAARAVPIAANAGLQIYADLAARLGADGQLTIDDRRRLAALAESYGISALQAHEIEAGLAR